MPIPPYPILSHPILSFVAIVWGWVALNGKVFDLTEFMDRHPGGPTAILAWAGILAMTYIVLLSPVGLCPLDPWWICNILQTLSSKLEEVSSSARSVANLQPLNTNQIRQRQVHALLDSSHEMLRKDASKFFNEIHKGGICMHLLDLGLEIGQWAGRAWVQFLRVIQLSKVWRLTLICGLKLFLETSALMKVWCF